MPEVWREVNSYITNTICREAQLILADNTCDFILKKMIKSV